MNHPYGTLVENFGEIREILFDGMGAKKPMYFKLIGERYYHMFLREDFNKNIWGKNC